VRVDVLTLFPEVFEPIVSSSMLGIAQIRGALEFATHDLRQWALPGIHRQVDDSPYGGGPGMVMRAEPLFAGIRAVSDLDPRTPFVVLTTPQGERLTQEIAESLALKDRLLIVCGRYEGVDERVRPLADLELSIGDYVLTGGELPAMVVIDAVSRLLPGVLGDERSAQDESFSTGLLEYPQYTRPSSWEGVDVPEVLLSGDHAKIAAWRRREAVVRTARRRPDLLPTADLTPDEQVLARDVSSPHTADKEHE
jgi:tRNA (guanine37-N1)-methyltransferase